MANANGKRARKKLVMDRNRNETKIKRPKKSKFGKFSVEKNKV